MRPVELRNRVVGAVQSDVREFDGRQVVWVDVDAGSVSAREIRFVRQDRERLAHRTDQRLPLIGSAVRGRHRRRLRAVHGWGLAAKALDDCSGVVQIHGGKVPLYRARLRDGSPTW